MTPTDTGEKKKKIDTNPTEIETEIKKDHTKTTTNQITVIKKEEVEVEAKTEKEDIVETGEIVETGGIEGVVETEETVGTEGIVEIEETVEKEGGIVETEETVEIELIGVETEIGEGEIEVGKEGKTVMIPITINLLHLGENLRKTIIFRSI